MKRGSLACVGLGMMLGARRPTVSLVLGTLAKAGLIQNATRSIVVINREGLEDASCECYEMVQATFDRLLPQHQYDLIQQKNRRLMAEVVTQRTTSDFEGA